MPGWKGSAQMDSAAAMFTPETPRKPTLPRVASASGRLSVDLRRGLARVVFRKLGTNTRVDLARLPVESRHGQVLNGPRSSVDIAVPTLAS